MTVRAIRLTTPLKDADLKDLKIGDKVLLSGEIYAARDAAHKRLVELIRKNKPLPFDPKGAVIYYTGPTPARPGQIIGSCGPTTSSRMDAYMADILSAGIKATIGKGGRSPEVRELQKKHRAVYFSAVGGTGAILSENVTKVELVAWEALGAEALRRLTVKDFPVIVANDLAGNDLFLEARTRWAKKV